MEFSDILSSLANQIVIIENFEFCHKSNWNYGIILALSQNQIDIMGNFSSLRNQIGIMDILSSVESQIQIMGYFEL